MSKATKAAKVATVAVVKTPATEKRPEGLTKATVATNVISFNAGSGSQDLLELITRIGFDRDAVLKAAAKLKAAGKAFLKSDPEKKYNKVAGIIKRLQNAGYKLPQAQ